MSIYPTDLVIAFIFGILTTICFSIYPIGKACQVRAADLFRRLVTTTQNRPSLNIILGLLISLQMLALFAIITSSDTELATMFVFGTIVTIVVFWALAQGLKLTLRSIRHIRKPAVRFAISNLYRPGNSTNSLILSLGLGLTVFVAIGLVEYNFSQKLQDNINGDMPSFFLLDVQKNQIPEFKKVVDNFETARDLELTPQLRGRIKLVNGIEAEKAFKNNGDGWVLRGDRGFTYTDALPANSTITQGEWWDSDYSGAPIVSISTDVANAFDIGVDDELTINILGFDITAKVANVREIDWGSFLMNFAVTFAPGSLDDAPATFLATVKTSEASELEFQSEIAKNFANISVIRLRDALSLANKVLGTVAQAVRYSAAVTLLAGVLVLAGAIAAGQKRRIYDAVVFKTMGVDRKQMMRVFLSEYIILGLMASVAAAILGSIGAWFILTKVMDLGWIFNGLTVLWVVLIALVIAVSFGMSATWRILGIKPAPYLRNE